MRFSNWELGTKQWFVLVEAYWLTAICVSRRPQKKREGGQFKLSIDSFCQRPVLTHTSESLLHFISSLKLKKWTLLLPTDQLFLDSITLPQGFRVSPQWPVDWFHAKNMSPEDWQWDIKEEIESKQCAKIARLHRAELLRLLAPLQAARLAPMNIASATQPFTPEELPDAECSDSFVVQHLTSLYLAIHGTRFYFAKSTFNLKRTPLERASRRRFRGGLTAAVIISTCCSLWIYHHDSTPTPQHAPMLANIEIEKPNETTEAVSVNNTIALDKNEHTNPCPKFDQQSITINAIYRESATSIQEALTFIVITTQQQMKKLYLHDLISSEWQLTEIQSERIVWSHTASQCSVEQEMSS